MRFGVAASSPKGLGMACILTTGGLPGWITMKRAVIIAGAVVGEVVFCIMKWTCSGG